MAVLVPDGAAPHLRVTLTVVRHASTAWTRTGQHTGRTDIPLDDDGRKAATALAPSLAAIGADRVYSSPLERARETCALTGLTEPCEIDPDLLEWDYGEYEGRTTAQIHHDRPGWDLFRDGCPGGENASDVGRRADAFLAKISEAGERSVIAFAHGHVLRVMVARWLGLPPNRGASFMLSAPSVSTLGREHDNAVVVRWNV